MAKSLCVTYLLWLVGGCFGLHHFYLKRYKQALVWWFLPGGYFGAGWIRDLWRIPEYVRDANNDPDYIKRLTNQMRKNDKPPFSFVRCCGELVLGNVLGVVVSLAVPNQKDLGFDLSWLSMLLSPIATALGIWLVGNIGRERGSLFPPLVACCSTWPLLVFGFTNAAVPCIAGIIAFNWKAKQWRRTVREPPAIWKTFLVLTLCGGLYTSLWVSYMYFNLRIVTKDGDEIPARDAVRNFIKSPAFREFWKNLGALWQHAREFGFMSTFQQLIESLDPLGEKNALKVLGLSKGVSQEEIKARYRELSKKWHPDREKDPEKKEEAQEKFVEIQQAYERLSDIKSSRARRNRMSADNPGGSQNEEAGTKSD